VFDYLLEQYPDWSTTLEITKGVLSNNVAATAIMEDLEEQGLIESRKIKKGGQGRPAVEYRVIEI
jgi:predicted ArsR family transcriptional regulator